MAADQGLDDHPLTDVEAEGAAGPVLRRAENAGPVAEREHPGAGQPFHHPHADRIPLELQTRRKPDIQAGATLSGA